MRKAHPIDEISSPDPHTAVLLALGIDPKAIKGRGLTRHDEATDLEIAETGSDGRDFLLSPQAASAWQEMKAAAAADGVQIFLGSAFRSVARQTEIIRKKLEQGRHIDDILISIAAPGYSEHHTGRAVDIVSADVPEIAEAFEATSAFRWLSERAQEFGFVMSYPRGNRHGYIYEPWHWCFHPVPREYR
jgi:D-alanyl-D-alanine carboxypeptidase